jgi:hypothetical protein
MTAREAGANLKTLFNVVLTKNFLLDIVSQQ